MKRSKRRRRRASMAASRLPCGLDRRAPQPSQRARSAPRAARQAEDVGRGVQPGPRRSSSGCSPRRAPRYPWRCGRRNASAARPSAPGRSARRCSAAPPRPAGARHGCRRPGRCRGRRRAWLSAGRFSSTTETICGMTSPARCSTTVSPTRTSLRAISSSLCSVACCTMTPPTLTGCITARGVSAPVRPTWISMPQQRGGRLLGGEFPGDRPARRAADEAEPASASPAGPACRPRRRCRRRGRRAARPSRAWKAAAACSSGSRRRQRVDLEAPVACSRSR